LPLPSNPPPPGEQIRDYLRQSRKGAKKGR
jgi:hypothetical protein